MKCEIVDRGPGVPDVFVEATPVCGEDFCDRCGDCLSCYGGGHDVCPLGCRWIVYADIAPEKAASLLASGPADTGRTP